MTETQHRPGELESNRDGAGDLSGSDTQTTGAIAGRRGDREALNVTNAASMAEWLRQTIGTGPLSGMFYRNGAIVHCPRVGQDGYIPPTDERDHDGSAQVRPLTDRTLASQIQYTYWCRRKDDEDKPPTDAMFPKDAARVAVDVPDQLLHLRPLRGVTHSPIVRRDGSVLSAPGYDDATGLMYLPDPSLVVPPVPEHPTAQQVEEAIRLLGYMVSGFDFVSKSDRANYYGLLLTPLLRELAPPPYKLGAIGAPQPGAGKSLLASILRIVHDDGHGGVFRAEMPHDEAELEKTLSSILTCTTAPVVQFDNVTGTLRSSRLAGLFTSRDYSGRILGSTNETPMINDRVWVITGNNLSLGGDLVRRTLWVTINPNCQNPHTRTGFAIEHLEEWVRINRGHLLAALLTLIRAWVAAGQQASRRGSDSFARWIGIIDAILSVAGVEGTFDDPETAQQIIGADDEGWREFLEAVHDAFGEAAWTVKELLNKVDDGQRHTIQESARASYSEAHPIPMDALPTELIEKARSHLGLAVIAKSLGMWLRNRRDKWVGPITVRSGGKDRSKVALWKIQTSDGHSE